MPGSERELFRTHRLRARRLTIDDLPTYAALYSDEESVRYLGVKPHTNEAESRAVLERTLARNESYGERLGIWALERLSDGKTIGTIICNNPRASNGYTPSGEVPEVYSDKIQVGWHLITEARGQGFATEAGRAILEYALGELGAEEVYVLTEQPHRKSQAVAERLGLKPAGLTTEFYDLEMAHYIARR